MEVEPIGDPPPLVFGEDSGPPEMGPAPDQDPAPIERDMPPPVMLPDIPETPECDEAEPDPPDRFGFDTNCDGIDGDIARSVFVAPYGDDGNEGSRTAPKATIGAGIQAAAMDPGRDWVLVQIGRYGEDVVLVDGVHIAGGYELGWRRDGDGFSTVIGGNPTVRGADITSPTRVMNLEVRAKDATDPSETVITVLLERSSGVELERMFIIGGTAGRGADGARGQMGTTGAGGDEGDDGRTDSGIGCASDGRPVRTDGAISTCGGGNGGHGGRPGHVDKGDSDPGGQGEPSQTGAPGGAPGAGGPKETGGDDGEDGAPGEEGSPGAGAGRAGSFSGVQWGGQTGQPGTRGTFGSGGGGGGGGGGGDLRCDSWGGSGGGGGAGGCGGAGGEGGQAGGASVALFLLQSDVRVTASRIVVGQGGDGGRGGAGGPGGDGGPGGPGGEKDQDSGPGGRGGDGGKGGPGGRGGGGAGGPAFGIYADAPLSQDPIETVYIPGSGGFGGSGGGGAGRGAEGATVNLQVGPVSGQ